MELDEFVAETLIQISHGVTTANERMEADGARANPLSMQLIKAKSKQEYLDVKGNRTS